MVVDQGGEVGVGEDEIGLGEEDALPLDAGLLQPPWSTVSIDKENAYMHNLDYSQY